MPMENLNFESEVSMKKMFFIKIFSGLHYNANTLWIIQRMWKVFIVVSQAVNDTSGSAHVIQHPLCDAKYVYDVMKNIKKNVVEKPSFIEIFDLNFTIT